MQINEFSLLPATAAYYYQHHATVASTTRQPLQYNSRPPRHLLVVSATTTITASTQRASQVFFEFHADKANHFQVLPEIGMNIVQYKLQSWEQ